MKSKLSSLEFRKFVKKEIPKKESSSDLKWIFEMLGWEKNVGRGK